MSKAPVIYIIDDSSANLEFLQIQLQELGYETQCFGSAEDFIAAGPFYGLGCILLDNVMPGMSGLDLQQQLLRTCPGLPVIFMSGSSDYEQVFDASRSGALAFLQKPVRRSRLLPLVQQAIAESLQRASNQDQTEAAATRYAQLSEREKEVFRLLADGSPNKEVARQLDISLRTAEFHRANVLRKLDARLVSDLIALARKLGF